MVGDLSDQVDAKARMACARVWTRFERSVLVIATISICYEMLKIFTAKYAVHLYPFPW
jgi:hypothetical protein